MNPLFHMIFQKTRLLQKNLNQALKEHNLFSSQWTVLYCVHQHGEMTLTDIWKYLNVEAPTITRTVSRLETLGWLSTFSGKDRREKFVRLSENAIAKFPEIQETIIKFEQQAVEGLTEEEQAHLLQLLKKME